jgi:hypothetical protein
MGIHGPFASMLKACSPLLKLKKALGKESPLNDTMSDVCSALIGTDMSIVMMSAVKSDRGRAEEFHQVPPYPAHHVAVAVLTLLRKIEKAGFRVLRGLPSRGVWSMHASLCLVATPPMRFGIHWSNGSSASVRCALGSSDDRQWSAARG